MKQVEEFEEVRKARARLARLRERKRELGEELREVRFGSPEPSVEDMAEEIRAGGTVTEAETRSAADVQREIRATERAVQKAREEVSAAEKKARGEVLREPRPRYERVQSRMAKLVRKLLDAAEDEADLRAEMNEAGAKPLASGFSNRLPEGGLRRWLERAEEDFNA